MANSFAHAMYHSDTGHEVWSAYDYQIKIKDGAPHAYPVFTFLKEGREGEREIIDEIRAYYESRYK